MAQQITDQELAFYRKHPELVQAVGDKKTIYQWVLFVVFVSGFVLVIISKLIKYGALEAPDSMTVEIAVDLVFELGVALWGGVATTVLLQSFVERKYEQGREYQQEIMKRLDDDAPPGRSKNPEEDEK